MLVVFIIIDISFNDFVKQRHHLLLHKTKNKESTASTGGTFLKMLVVLCARTGVVEQKK